MARADNLMAAAAPEGFVLGAANDILALDGIYYFSWIKGDGKSITNADGEDAAVYDCQVYLLAAKCNGIEEAQAEIAEWKAVEAGVYKSTEAHAVSAFFGDFTCLSLSPVDDSNPLLPVPQLSLQEIRWRSAWRYSAQRNPVRTQQMFWSSFCRESVLTNRR